MTDEEPVFDAEGKLLGWWVESDPSYVTMKMIDGSEHEIKATDYSRVFIKNTWS